MLTILIPWIDIMWDKDLHLQKFWPETFLIKIKLIKELFF